MAGWNAKGIIGALALFGAGLFFVLHGLSYPLGTMSRMGPGYYPVLLGIVAIGLSLLMLCAAKSESARLPAIAWRPLGAVLGAILAVMLTIRLLGLVPAIMLTVFISGLADRRSRPRETLLLAASLAFGAWLVFSKGLGMPMPVFRWPF